MEYDLRLGMKYEHSLLVTHENTADALGSGQVLVFATPALVANLEKAAMMAVASGLPAGCTTVGTKVDIDHLAATPVGMKVTFSATLTEIDRKRLVFEVAAYDEKEKIGGGRHERFIIDIERFVGKANMKMEG